MPNALPICGISPEAASANLSSLKMSFTVPKAPFRQVDQNTAASTTRTSANRALHCETSCAEFTESQSERMRAIRRAVARGRVGRSRFRCLSLPRINEWQEITYSHERGSWVWQKVNAVHHLGWRVAQSARTARREADGSLGKETRRRSRGQRPAKRQSRTITADRDCGFLIDLLAHFSSKIAAFLSTALSVL
jgi:hypothetical protein